jgi:hypothetical protein
MLLVAEVLVERLARDARVRHDVRDRGRAVAVLRDRFGHRVEQPAALRREYSVAS